MPASGANVTRRLLPVSGGIIPVSRSENPERSPIRKPQRNLQRGATIQDWFQPNPSDVAAVGPCGHQALGAKTKQDRLPRAGHYRRRSPRSRGPEAIRTRLFSQSRTCPGSMLATPGDFRDVAIDRMPIHRCRRSDLLRPPGPQHADPVGAGQRLLLVMRHNDRGDAKPPQQPQQIGPCLLPQVCGPAPRTGHPAAATSATRARLRASATRCCCRPRSCQHGARPDPVQAHQRQ